MIYLDNNATTRAANVVKKVMTDWIQCGSNPSGNSKIATISATLVNRANSYIQKLCNAKKYTVVWTSGATEANCLIIRSIVDSFWRTIKSKPHIISSTIEHKSIIECLHQLAVLDRLELTLVNPNSEGIVDPEAVRKSIQKNTCLVTIMYANNELGSINPVKRIAEIAHERKVPFHTDAVQIFGKMSIDMSGLGIDALSMSFHKLRGPMGVGLLIIKNSLVEGYHLEGQMAGTQQNGLRGGTENIPAIAGAYAAMVENFKSRKAKNAKLLRFREAILKCFGKHFDMLSYPVKESGKGRHLVVLGPKKNVLPNTILVSLVDYDVEVCNIKMKQLLESKGVIVSIGSACNTNVAKASHVLGAIKAPAIVRRGVLRISMGDDNTADEIKQFCRIFVECFAPKK